jgi:hypothetical protein
MVLKVEINVSKDYSRNVITLIDSGSDLNFIQEGLVRSKYFEKSTERLNYASGNRLHINYELNNIHVCRDDVCFHILSMLAKNMYDKVILGLLFIATLYPFSVNETGISTNKMGLGVKFSFESKFDIDIN